MLDGLFLFCLIQLLKQISIFIKKQNYTQMQYAIWLANTTPVYMRIFVSITNVQSQISLFFFELSSLTIHFLLCEEISK